MTLLHLAVSDYHRKLEAASKQPPGSIPVAEIKKDLEQGDDLCDIATRYGLLTDPELERHLREDWYGPNGWWSQYEPEKVVRQSYLEMLRLYTEKPRRIRTLWVLGHDGFAVVTDDTQEQITRTLLTPAFPEETETRSAAGRGSIVQWVDGGAPSEGPLRKVVAP